MRLVAGNATLEGMRHLTGCRYVLLDRDTKFCLEKEFAGVIPANAVSIRGLDGLRAVERHLKTHALQLADVLAFEFLRVPSEEVVGPQILVMSVGLEHVVADHQDTVGDREGRLLETPPRGDALMLGTQVAVLVFDGSPRSFP
jgi:hypothetical protein